MRRFCSRIGFEPFLSGSMLLRRWSKARVLADWQRWEGETAKQPASSGGFVLRSRRK